MESFVLYWQIVTEFTVPWKAHLPINGALWWSIDSNSAIFCFRISKFSIENGNWEMWHAFTSYVENDKSYFL